MTARQLTVYDLDERTDSGKTLDAWVGRKIKHHTFGLLPLVKMKAGIYLKGYGHLPYLL